MPPRTTMTSDSMERSRSNAWLGSMMPFLKKNDVLVLADRHEREAELRAPHEVARRDRGQRDDDHRVVRELRGIARAAVGAVDREVEGHADGAAEWFEVRHECLHRLVDADRREREVRTAQAQDRDADEGGDRRRRERARDRGEEEVRVEREHEPERDVAADAEEDDVPEGHVAGVTHDDVDARRESDEHEHEEQLFTQRRVIGDDRQHGDQREQHQKRRQERRADAPHAREPKRPDGRTSRMSTKITYSSTGTHETGMKTVVTPSRTPSTMPPTSAPVGLPRPPSTTMTKLLIS